MADPGPPEDRLSDGLLLLRADVLLRSRLGALDDRDDVYVLREVAAPDTPPAACAVVRRTGDHATLSHLTGPPNLLNRLIREICDALRADGAATLSAAPGIPAPTARTAGLTNPIPL